MGREIGVKLEIPPKKKQRLSSAKSLVKKPVRRIKRSVGIAKKIFKLATKVTIGLGRIATIALVGRW